jgi:hypothetical protein
MTYSAVIFVLSCLTLLQFAESYSRSLLAAARDLKWRA